MFCFFLNVRKTNGKQNANEKYKYSNFWAIRTIIYYKSHFFHAFSLFFLINVWKIKTNTIHLQRKPNLSCGE